MKSISQENNQTAIDFESWMQTLEINDAKSLQRLLNEVQIGKKVYNMLSGLNGPLAWILAIPETYSIPTIAHIKALTECNEDIGLRLHIRKNLPACLWVQFKTTEPLVAIDLDKEQEIETRILKLKQEYNG